MSNAQDIQQIIDTVIKARQTNLDIAPTLQRANITLAEWIMLEAISKADQSGLTMSELSERLKISLPMVTAQHKRLKVKGFTKTHTPKTDKRSRVTTCTSKAKDTLDTIRGSLNYNR
jgi:DNA-binding MarR family transcriptional regulator